MNIKTILVIYISLLVSFVSAADLELASPFSEHMVLQRQMPIPVWGWGKPGSKISVEFASKTTKGKVRADGRWKVILPAVNKAGGPHKFTVKSGDAVIEYKDVLVGEVWICSGQSNMQQGRGVLKNAKQMLVVAAKKPIRCMEVKRTVRFEPQERCSGKWSKQTPNSAVAFAFAYYLNKDQDIPVGIILTCWSSSSIEGWMPLEMQKQLPHFKTHMDKFKKQDTKKVTALITQEKKGKKWAQKDNVFLRTRPNILYNAMMHPLIPYAARGIVWYQGEANSETMQTTKQYGTTLSLWCKELRNRWGRIELCFIPVMLPRFGKILPKSPSTDPGNPSAYSWAYFREAQMKILDLPNTAIANTIDLGALKNIHPRDKELIGKRLALLAGGLTGDAKGLVQGPVFSGMKKEGKNLRISFKNADGLKTIDGKPPAEFWVAGKDNKWVQATTKISKDSVILSWDGKATPVAVRYAFAGFPKVNLVNSAGLPAIPFRTDTN